MQEGKNQKLNKWIELHSYEQLQVSSRKWKRGWGPVNRKENLKKKQKQDYDQVKITTRGFIYKQ